MSTHRLTRRLPAISMLELVMVLAVVGVVLAGAIALGRGEMSKLQAKQVVAELRQALASAGETASASGSYEHLGGVLVAATGQTPPFAYAAPNRGADLVAAMGGVPERSIVGDTVLLGGRYRLHMASGNACTGPCATAGLNTHAALLVAIGTNAQPVDDAAVCTALMNWDSRALRLVSLQPHAAAANNVALPLAPTASPATGNADTITFLRATLTNASRLAERRANADDIVRECEEYEDNPGRGGTVVLGFLGYAF